MNPGTELGVYTVLEPIGSGGMGEVFRARDERLERDVAIKILPEAFASDADRLARFEREAKLLAQLNHPGIATLHGLEEANGTRFLVMELVPGETLAERIAQGRIPVDESLELARDALTPLTSDGQNNGYPVWSPDGAWVAFASDRDGAIGAMDLYRKRADFSGAAERLLDAPYDQYPEDWSPDGTALAFWEFVAGQPRVMTPASDR